MILFLPTILTQTITPILIKIREQGTQEDYVKNKKRFVSIITWISILLSFFVSLTAYWLIFLTYGKAYLAAVPVLQIMAWKTVGMALSSSGGQIIIMEGKQKWAVIRNLVGCIACVVLNLLFIPKYGIIGAAWVTIVTLFFSGTIANVLIPAYREVFKIQLYALFYGYKELGYIRELIKNKK